MPEGIVTIIISSPDGRILGGVIKQQDDTHSYFDINNVKEESKRDIKEKVSVTFDITFRINGSSTGTNISCINKHYVANKTSFNNKTTQSISNSSKYDFLNPYNFARFLKIPVNEQPHLLNRCSPPPHDRYVGMTGKLTCAINPQTTFFISGEEIKNEKQHKTYDFFKINGTYAIPETTIRGTIRSLFETITGSCLGVFEGEDDLEPLEYRDQNLSLKLFPARVEKAEESEKFKLNLLTGTTPLKVGEPLEATKDKVDTQYAAWVYGYWPIDPSNTLEPPTNPNYRVNNSKTATGFRTRRQESEKIDLTKFKHGQKCYALMQEVPHAYNRIKYWEVLKIGEKSELETEKIIRIKIDKEGIFCIKKGWLCITRQNTERKHSERFFFNDKEDECQRVDLLDDVCKKYETLIKNYQERHQKRLAKEDSTKDSDFRITRQSLYSLKIENVPDEILEKLEKLKNQDIIGKENFLEILDNTIGNQENTKFKLLIIKHAKKEIKPSRFVIDKSEKTLSEGTLVYALLEKDSTNPLGKVKALVPVAVPRIAYEKSLTDILKNSSPSLCYCNKYEELCPTCRLFGWVKKGLNVNNQTRNAYAGRVNFSFGELKKGKPNFEETTLNILSSPQPTATNFYLLNKNGLKGIIDYNTEGVQLRGRKFYQCQQELNSQEYTTEQKGKQNRTIKEVFDKESEFEFTIRFENLAPLELGALLWSLELEKEWFHRIGYAKPFGFGSVKIQVTQMDLLDLNKYHTEFEKVPIISYKENDNNNKLKDFKTKLVNKFKQEIESLCKTEFKLLPTFKDLESLLTPTNSVVRYPSLEWFAANKREKGSDNTKFRNKQALGLAADKEPEPLKQLTKKGDIPK